MNNIIVTKDVKYIYFTKRLFLRKIEILDKDIDSNTEFSLRIPFHSQHLLPLVASYLIYPSVDIGFMIFITPFFYLIYIISILIGNAAFKRKLKYIRHENK